MTNSDPNTYSTLIDRDSLPLPYYKYNEDDYIFHNADGGLSIVFLCKPYGGAGVESGLVSLMSSIPEGAAIQLLLYSSPDITDLIDRWKTIKTVDGDLYRSTRDSYADFIESKAKEIMSPNMRVRISDYKLVITISLGGKSDIFSLGDRVKNLFGSKKNKDYKNEYMERYEKMKELHGRLSAALKAANLFPENVDPDKLIRIVYPLLNPNHDFRNIPRWKGSEDISDNCVANDTVFEVAHDHIRFDNRYARSMSVKNYSYDWYCGMSEHLIGNPFGNQTIESNVLYCLNVINIGKSGINKVKRKSQIILSQNLPDHLFPLLGMKKRDLAMANKELERGKTLFHINYCIIPIANSYDELNNASGQLQAYYQRLGFTIEEDRYINLPVLLSTLPGNYDERFKDDLKRGIIVFLENAVDLAPVAADWGGNTANPEVFFFTPRGQLFSFDFFASNTNYNSFVIGTSGAGKSVALQSIAMNYLMSNDLVRIIDIGGSYENFCNILDGQYIDIKPETPICLNPWTDISDEKTFNEFSEFLADWYWMMGSPADYKLSQEHEKYIKSWLAIALKKSFDKYSIDSNVDTVVECLRHEVVRDSKIGILDARMSDFIQILSSYMSTGIYGAFFNGKAEITFSSNIVVLETGSMENIPALRDPIIMILTYHISKSIYLGHNTENKKHLVIIDEAHKFLGNHKIDGFVEQAYRRFRKHKASMIIGTQGYEDLSGDSGNSSRAGRVIIDNSAFQIFMKQSPSSAEKLKNSESHNFDEYEKSMIDSIKSVKGEYSEAILIHENLKVKLRIVLDPFQKKMFFTTPDMRNYIRERVRNGMSFIDALNSMPDELII